MRFRVTTRIFLKNGKFVEQDQDEQDCKLLEPYGVICAGPTIRSIELRMIGDNYVEVIIEQVID